MIGGVGFRDGGLWGMGAVRDVRILVVDDEQAIAAMLTEYFELQGYAVTVAHSGSEALAAVNTGAPPDLILLDVNMPGMDGFSVCRRIREHLNCPIIFLTARIEDVDQIDGFAAGADDYVLKPFSLEVLGHRVAAHLARQQRQAGHADKDHSVSAVRFFGPVTIDYARRTVTVMCARRAEVESEREVEVNLTRTEFDIIALLSKRAGQVFDRDVIYQQVWGWNALGDPSIVREHVRRIRRKLADAGVAVDCIETVWGVGYKWVAR